MLVRSGNVEMARRVQDFLRPLGLSTPATVDDVCRAFAVHRGRRLVVRADVMPRPELYALLLRGRDFDVISHEWRVDGPHRDHIVGHELAHIALGHRVGMVDTELARDAAAMTDLEVNQILGVAARTDFSVPEERDAELFAGHLIAALASGDGPMPRAGTVQARLRASLEYPG